MNILFVQRQLDPYRGGIERVTFLLSEWLSKRGIICFHAYADECDSDELKTDRTFRYDIKGGDSQLELFVEYIRRWTIDTVIIQDIHGAGMSSLRKRLRKEGLSTKVIAVMHLCPDYEKFKKYPLKTRLKQHVIWCLLGYYKPRKEEAFFARNADKVVVLSPSYIKPVRKMYGILKKDKVIAIPNPLVFPMSDNPDWNSRDNAFLVVARMDEKQKNLTSACRIWKQFETTDEIGGWRFDIAGGRGGCEEQIMTFGRSLNCNRLNFLGQIKNPQYLYRRSKFYVMTSRYEGLPMTLMEAMQSGCVPIVMDSFSSVHDIIDDGINGILVPAGDENAFLQAMKKIVADPDRGAEMSQTAWKSIQKFDMDTIGQKWMKII